MKKKYLLIYLVSLSVSLYIIFGANFQKTRSLILAHNLNTDHPVHKAMEFLSNEIRNRTDGRLQIKIYPGGQLGSEREVIELVQLGAVGMTKVSSNSLESFAPEYAVLNLPYIFKSKVHYYRVLDGSVGEEILRSSLDRKILGLTYYDAGARSFYSHKPIMHPSDLKGLKLRVMGSQTAIKMVKLMGGAPTPMPYGELYTALQQGVVDGAENNVTALTLNRHGEVSKHYSLDEHAMLPDVLIMSARIWQNLSPSDKDIVKTVAEESKHYQRKLWNEVTEKLILQAKNEMGVKFYNPDKEAFTELVLPLHKSLAQRGPVFSSLIDRVKSFTR